MGKDVIIACDFADKETALNFLDKFEGRKPFVKIGMELFYAEGPQIVREIKADTKSSSTSSFTISRTRLKRAWLYSRGSMSICATSTPRAHRA